MLKIKIFIACAYWGAFLFLWFELGFFIACGIVLLQTMAIVNYNLHNKRI